MTRTVQNDRFGDARQPLGFEPLFRNLAISDIARLGSLRGKDPVPWNIWAPMRLSKLYSNKPEIFGPIDFVQGLNVVMAEIRLPENRDKDTHNLGKTTLGRVLDFTFLAGKDTKSFMFKHFDTFKEFVFFLEIELSDASFLTVRRGVEEATKISFKKHEASHQDFTSLTDSGWDHFELPFDRAKEMLDSLLDWRALKPWSYRKEIGYLLRSQDDYRDVFHLNKFASAHSSKRGSKNRPCYAAEAA